MGGLWVSSMAGLSSPAAIVGIKEVAFNEEGIGRDVSSKVCG